MTSRYILVTDGETITPAEQDALTKRFLDLGWQVWHWFDNAWLLVLPEGDPGKTEPIAHEVREALSDRAHFFVQSLSDAAAYDFKAKVKGPAVEWILKNWDPLVIPDPPPKGRHRM
jgi:hypothetical protein